MFFPQEIADHFLLLFFIFSRLPEHKNMPLEDALGLINRDFSRYCQAVREGHMRQQQSNRPPDVGSAPGGSSDLTIEQITSVIDNLQQKKNELIKKQGINFEDLCTQYEILVMPLIALLCEGCSSTALVKF